LIGARSRQVKTPLRRLAARCSAALVGGLLLGHAAASGASAADDAPVWLVADKHLTVATAAGAGALPLYLSEDWSEPRPAITRAVITIHGLERPPTLREPSRKSAARAPGLIRNPCC